MVRNPVKFSYEYHQYFALCLNSLLIKDEKVGFMYINYFRLLEIPFSLIPNSKFNYFSDRHKETLNCLLANDHAGLAILTGEVGTGKTVTAEALFKRLSALCKVSLLTNPTLSVLGFMQYLCESYDIDYTEQDDYDALFRLFARKLLANFEQGLPTVLLIDEAHLLKDEVLDQLYLLLNIEVANQALLKVILIGQPDLLFSMRRTQLCYLIPELSARCHLSRLNLADTEKYINHRLSAAGRVTPLFQLGAIKVIHRQSGGIARMINLLCEQALKIAFEEGKTSIDRKIANQACRILIDWRDPDFDRQEPLMRYAPAMLTGLAVLIGGMAILGGIHLLSAPKPQLNASNYLANKVQNSQVSSSGFDENNFETDALTNNTAAPKYLNETLILDEAPSFDSNTISAEKQIQEELVYKDGKLEVATETLPYEEEKAVQIVPNNDGKADIAHSSEAQASFEPPVQTTKAMFPSQRIDKNNVASFFNLLLDEDDAFMLMKNWWQGYDLGDGNCASLVNKKPSCIRTTFDIDKLLALDHPAVLEFVDKSGKKGYGIFYAAENNQVKLLVDNMRFVMDADLLASLWKGRTQVIWLPPEIDRKELVYGKENASIAWLDRRLRDYFKDASAPSAYFDDMLLKKIRLFQRKHNLVVDGIPGAMTLLTLTMALDDPTQPLLKTVDDSPWENWLLEQRGLLESFDIISEKRDNSLMASKPTSASKQAVTSAPQKTAQPKERQWLDDLNNQGFIQLGARPSGEAQVKKAKPASASVNKPASTSVNQTVAPLQKQEMPSGILSEFVKIEEPDVKVLEKVTTDQHLTTFDGQPIEVGREIVINQHDSGFRGLTSPVMLEDVDVTKLPEELAQKVMLAIHARENKRPNSVQVQNTQMNKQAQTPKAQVQNEPMTTERITQNIRENMERTQNQSPSKASIKPDDTNVVRVEQLSTSLHERLPKMNFQAHIYSSDNARRWVRVNGNVFKEGDTISSNVRLRRIDPNQVVVEFEDSAIAIPALWSY